MSTFRPDQLAPDSDRLKARKDAQTTLRAYARFLADPPSDICSVNNSGSVGD